MRENSGKGVCCGMGVAVSREKIDGCYREKGAVLFRIPK
jgi:hypothetical protein